MATPNSLRALHEANKGAITKGNMFSLPIDLIFVEEGFNTREYDRPEVQEHIRNIANAYKQGRDIDPMRVSVVDGKAYLRDGHCRYLGAKLAISEGLELPRLNVLPCAGDEIDQSLVIVTSNLGLKLTPVEQASVYARLITLGLTDGEIATRVGKTPQHVQQYLTVHNMPIEMKRMIQSDTVAMSVALKLFNEVGTAAVAILKDQLGEEAVSQPTTEDDKQLTIPDTEASAPALVSTKATTKPKRVTQKKIDAAVGYRSRLVGDSVKSVTEHFRSIVEMSKSATVEDDQYVLRLSKSDLAKIEELYAAILPKGFKEQGPAADEEVSPETASA
jgi:ParB family chromosome partitioning protein